MFLIAAGTLLIDKSRGGAVNSRINVAFETPTPAAAPFGATRAGETPTGRTRGGEEPS
jgi:hypothetical protein